MATEVNEGAFYSDNSLSSPSCPDAVKRKVSYFYEPEIGNYYYGPHHLMKPFRVQLTHSLVVHYGLCNAMTIRRPILATADDMKVFHDDDYIDFLRNISLDLSYPTISKRRTSNHLKEKYEVGGDDNNDCPTFPGVFPFFQASAGGSLEAAVKLINRSCDIAINWAGLHHAKQAKASGF